MNEKPKREDYELVDRDKTKTSTDDICFGCEFDEWCNDNPMPKEFGDECRIEYTKIFKLKNTTDENTRL